MGHVGRNPSWIDKPPAYMDDMNSGLFYSRQGADGQGAHGVTGHPSGKFQPY